jgi:transcriptional regulator with XRE-family HTH domain
MTDGPSVGDRICELRGKMTQQELADISGVSIDLIRKLEQGRRHTASIGSLQAIARALDVDIAALLAKPQPIATAEPDEGIIALRRALTPVDDLVDGEAHGEDLTVADAERTADYLWGAYWNGRYQVLAELLPAALGRLRATVRHVPASDRPAAQHALARTYQVAGDTLAHMGHTDLAFMAIRHALTAAAASGDELLHASMRVSVSWQLLVQGRHEESAQVAIKAATELGANGSASESVLSAYGLLTVTAATATARDLKRDDTVSMLAEAREAARRIGYDRSEWSSTFGPAKVAMLTVDCAVVQDDFSGALASAKLLPRDANLPLASRARHLADIALSHLRLDHDQKALDTLLAAESMAPEWIQFQTLPRSITSELLVRERRRSTPLREFAARIGAARG